MSDGGFSAVPQFEMNAIGEDYTVFIPAVEVKGDCLEYYLSVKDRQKQLIAPNC